VAELEEEMQNRQETESRRDKANQDLQLMIDSMDLEATL
jgi:hypothetical protein